jgi:hypothetical protein
MMRRCAGFQPDEARRKPGKESENLASSQLLAHDYAARLIDRMHLENVLCQIKTDCCNIAHGRLPSLVIFDDHHLWHSMPREGAIHPIGWRHEPQWSNLILPDLNKILHARTN